MSEIYCGSAPLADGWTGKAEGWLLGGHIWPDDTPAGTKCPRCGVELKLSNQDPPQTRAPAASEDPASDDGQCHSAKTENRAC